MPEPIEWEGVGESPVGLTPFGEYDNDPDFVMDAPKVADWCARRLGYPILSVEMVDHQFYACFEEAIMEYAHQVNQFNIREYLFDLRGAPQTTDITGKPVKSNPLPFLVELADEYGTAANVGGRVDLKHGSIDVTAGQAVYDLQALYADVSESGNRLEIRKVFHDRTPAVNRSYFFGDFYGANSFLTAFGWGQGSGYGIGGVGGFRAGFGATSGVGYPGHSYVLHPIFDTMLRTQAVEFADNVFRSAYSFKVNNNKIRLFPKPSTDFTLWFDYTVREERQSLDFILGDSGSISDYADIPYSHIQYNTINDVGRRWIYEYTLACAKDVLGHIRSKFSTIPIPNAEVTLDGDALRQEAQTDKDRLLEQLRETLEETGRARQLEKQKENANNMQEIFQKAPMYIQIG